MLIDNPPALQSWLVKVLAKLSEANPDALSKYVMALIKKDNKSESDLKKICIEQLDVFLQEETENFVNKLFEVITNKSYNITNSKGDGSRSKKESVGKDIKEISESETDTESTESEDSYKGNKSHKSSSSNVKSTSNFVKIKENFSKKDQKFTYVNPNINRDKTVKDNTTTIQNVDAVINQKQPEKSTTRDNIQETNKDNNQEPSKLPNISKSSKLMEGTNYKLPKANDLVSKSKAKRSKEMEHPKSALQSHSSTISTSPVTMQAGCRDYNEKGYCMKGDLCPYGHGKDAVVLRGDINSVLPFVSASSGNVSSTGVSLSTPNSDYPTSNITTDIDVKSSSTISTNSTEIPPSHFPSPTGVVGGLPGTGGSGGGMQSQQGALMVPLLPTPTQTLQQKASGGGLLGEAPSPLLIPRQHLLLPPHQSPSSFPHHLSANMLPPPPPPPLISFPSFYGGYGYGHQRNHPLTSAPPPFQFRSAGPQNGGNGLGGDSMSASIDLLNNPETNQYNPEKPGLIRDNNNNRSMGTNKRRLINSIKNKYYKTASFSSSLNLAQVQSIHTQPPPPPSRGGNRSFQGSGNRENRTLELRKIPTVMNTISQLNAYFQKFGQLTNIIVNYDDDPQSALVTFSSNAEAYKAYKCQDPIFNNRFVKVFWYNNLTTAATSALSDNNYLDTELPPQQTLSLHSKSHLLKQHVTRNHEGGDSDELEGEHLVRFTPVVGLNRRQQRFNPYTIPPSSSGRIMGGKNLHALSSGYDDATLAARRRKFSSNQRYHYQNQALSNNEIDGTQNNSRIIKLPQKSPNPETNNNASNQTNEGEETVTSLPTTNHLSTLTTPSPPITSFTTVTTTATLNAVDRQRLELTRARYDLLLKRIDNQKQLIEKMSGKPALFSGSVRATAIETMRELQESIEKIKVELDLFQRNAAELSSTSTTPNNPPMTTTNLLHHQSSSNKDELIKMTKKQILDAELELISKSHQNPPFAKPPTVETGDRNLTEAGVHVLTAAAPAGGDIKNNRTLRLKGAQELRDIHLRLQRLKRKKAALLRAASSTVPSFKNKYNTADAPAAISQPTATNSTTSSGQFALLENGISTTQTHVDRRPKTILCTLEPLCLPPFIDNIDENVACIKTSNAGVAGSNDAVSSTRNNSNSFNTVTAEELLEFLGIKLYPVIASSVEDVSSENNTRGDRNFPKFLINFGTRREAEHFFSKANAIQLSSSSGGLTLQDYKLRFSWKAPQQSSSSADSLLHGNVYSDDNTLTYVSQQVFIPSSTSSNAMPTATITVTPLTATTTTSTSLVSSSEEIVSFST